MNQKSLFKKFRESQVFWPLVAWVIILAVDAIIDPSFLNLELLKTQYTGSIYTATWWTYSTTARP